MNKVNIEKALTFDPLHLAEQLTGKGLDDRGTAALGFLLNMAHANHKGALLSAVGDSHSGMAVAQFIELAESLGFAKILEESIEGTPDTFYVFWRSGILLRLESYYGGNSINSADIYFNFKGPRSALQGCSNGLAKEEGEGVYIWDASADVREGFRTILERIECAGEILPRFIQRPFLWLLTYKDIQRPYNSKKINRARIAKFPFAVQRAITPRESR